ncbi:AAA-like domain-containing protein [Paraferrimonas haliotis]|uniref:histidine kinase n=1 Tax=Paraferrimonas haliotis TaxID=2013866 RepID=A0AA37TT63_9GAMM|nr:AAA-like domain-containing protein [Paraferrimonas haliotis]GLS82435.1 hypothetical protein GCM10007894_04120 [Paraferrimonas haliotis]
MDLASSSYQVGGSISSSTSIYVERQADQELTQALLEGKFCYVFNSRQMGKSSLLLHTKEHLQQQNITCCFIDVSRIGSTDTKSEQWYGGLVYELCRGFGLIGTFDVLKWWRELGELTPAQKLSDFLEKVLLPNCPGQLVVFLDEIDSVLSLPFSSDDFFSVIRFCFNQRAANKEFERLQFALFGVALPTDLMTNKTRSPFNIGHAVSLQGFQSAEAVHLVKGLPFNQDIAQAMVQRIVYWTGGQPFLTQKLCQLSVNRHDQPPLSVEQCCEWVDELIEQEVLADWEGQDNPEHLRTIRDRLLLDEQHTLQSLSIYQKVLEAGDKGLPLEQVSGHSRLYLTGLIEVIRGRIYSRNRLYTQVYDMNWVTSQLSARRPYFEAFNAWLDSGQSDEQLLQGQALQEARSWAKGKALPDDDYRFLAASQDAEKRKIEALNQQLTQEIKERELAQQQLKEALDDVKKAQQEAERANQAKSEFLRRVSHEVRTPINAVLGLSYLAQQGSDPVTMSYLEKIHNSANYLLGMIGDIVDYSQIEQGKLRLDPTPFYLDTLLDKLVDIIGQRAVNQGLALRLHSPLQPLPKVLGDELRLEQVLLNILTNAIKNTEHGSIDLSVNLLEQSENALTLAFSINDTGPGLPTAVIDALVDTEQHSPKNNSLGMGLNLCKQLVSLMNGTWKISAEPSKGSQVGFTITLATVGQVPQLQLSDTQDVCYFGDLPHPEISQRLQAIGIQHANDAQLLAAKLILFDPKLTQPKTLDSRWVALLPSGQNQSASLPKSRVTRLLNYPMTISKLDRHLQSMLHYRPQTDLQNETVTDSQWSVLVAEDNDINQQVISELLARWGIASVISENGQQALTAVQQQDFDLVLMDVNMPLMNGLQATEAIRALDDIKYQQLPIIAMTAHAHEEDRQATQAAGMNEHVTKPIDPNALKTTLEKYLNAPISAQTSVHSKRVDWLETIPQLRLRETLDRVADNRSLLQRLVRRFAEQYSPAQVDWQGLPHQTQAQQANWLHTLKGTSSNVGLADIAALAASMEQEAANQSLQLNQWQLLQQQVSQACTTIFTVSDNNTSAQTATQDKGNLKAQLTELYRLLEEDLSEAQQLLATLSEYPQYTDIASALDEFRTDDVEQLVHNWLQQLEDA